MVAVEALPVLSQYLQSREWIIEELAKLLQDEYWEVQMAAVK